MIDWTPSAVAIQLGPLPLYWYGIAYAVGLAVAYRVMSDQARRLGQSPDIISNGLIVIAVAALIGGRLYHVIDQWALYKDDLLKIVLPPYSGLGVFGGFVTGTLAFLVLVRLWRLSAWRWTDIVAPGLFAMQAIGRWGNFFNQELYGPPTNLPWGIAIDCAHRVVDAAAGIDYSCTALPLETTHFHPLFLYESLSATLGLVVIMWLSKHPPRWLRLGDLLPITVIWIGAARFMLEFLRIGNWRLGDIPTAQIFGAAFVVIGIACLVLRRRQGAPALLAGVVVADDEDDEDDFWDDDDEDDDDAADDDADEVAGADAGHAEDPVAVTNDEATTKHEDTADGVTA